MPRNLRGKDAQFTPGLSDRSFQLVDDFVTSLNVPNRIVALCADDTQLLTQLKVLKDRESGSWFIVGGTGEPLLIGDPDVFKKELEEGKIEKATKVSYDIFVLFICLSIAF